MKEKTKRTKTNKPICSRNNNERVGAGLVPAHNKGITLIALILTIIVLLILAVVAINAVKGDGIIAHAKNARDLYRTKSEEENALLQNYLEQINKEINGGGSSSDGDKKIDGITVKGSLNAIISTTANTPLTDDFGNKIKVPAGFKIITKTDTENTDLNYTADDIDVTKGIVVEDGEGNQFVWIPVGTIYTDAEKTEANAKTITLGRYSNFTKTNNAYTVAQNASEYATPAPITTYYSYTEYNTTQGNAIAKNIGEFCTKALASGGYYIGRYEARTGTERKSSSVALTPVASKANDYVYNYVTQRKASSLCQSMYTNKPYESDLVNSYAWDTAIVFIQEFENSTYSQTKGLADDNKLSNKGLSILRATNAVDKQCNIYDMAGNCGEWSTETSSDSGFSCAVRGGNYNYSNFFTSIRDSHIATSASDYISFRPLLYM